MSIRVGYGQFEPAYAEPDVNRETMSSLARSAGAFDLLVFPELAVTGYDLRDADHARALAEPFDRGATAEWAVTLANDCQGAIVVGYAEASGETIFNSCLMALPDGRVYNYRKIHLFSREKDLFTTGDSPAPVIDTPFGRVGLMICFDWIFPETMRSLALAGAQIVVHPSNLVLPYCQRAMYARCVENRVFAITANRIGTETQAGRELTFTGASQILSPQGETLSSAPIDEISTDVVSINPSDADDKQLNEYNNLFDDRRGDLYSL